MKEYKERLEKEEPILLGKEPHAYFKVMPSAEFNAYLTKEGFYKLHSSNSGQIVSLHQIIAFFECGGKEALDEGFECDGAEWNVHHYDGNTLNNNADNLVYIPVGLHKNATKIQNNIRLWGKRKSRKQAIFNKKDIKKVRAFTKKGKEVKRFWDWVSHIILNTVKRFSRYFKIAIEYKALGMWIIKIIKRLKVQVDPSFVPNYLLKDYIVKECLG